MPDPRRIGPAAGRVAGPPVLARQSPPQYDAQSSALPLISQTATVFTPYAQDMGIFAPLRIDQEATPGLINRAATTFAPTFTLGNVNVSPAIISQTAAIFAPTRIDQEVTPGLINRAATIFAPTRLDQTVSPALISQTATPFAPTRIDQEVRPGLISQVAVTFSPTLSAGNVNVSPAIISQAATTFTPTRIDQEARPGLISQAATTFSPSFTIEVSPALISQSPSVFAPSRIDLEARPGVISQIATVFAPSLAAQSGAQTVSPGLIAQGAVVFVPLVTGIQDPGAPVFLADFMRTPADFSQRFGVPAIKSLAQAFAPGLEQGPSADEQRQRMEDQLLAALYG